MAGLTGLGGMSSSMRDAEAAALLSNWKMTPATMYARLDPSWIAGRWLQYLSFRIAQCIMRGNCGLLLSAPPRHGKSKLSTIATPLWVLEHFPNKSVVVATYGEELSTDFSREIRDHIEQNQDILSIRLRKDAKRVQNILTTKGGGLKAVGLQGTITGRGADVLIIDDYIKNPKEAMSATYLDDLWQWWVSVARTRLEPGAVVIILATRWVIGDLHGQIMKKQKETGRRFFEYIEMPAIAGPNDVLGRKEGDVLFPERLNKEMIYDIRTDLGSRWFEAMYQQNPLGDENAVINLDWFKHISQEDFAKRMKEAESHHQLSQWIRYWDLASTKEAGDYTCGALCWYNKVTEEFYVRSLRRGQFSPGKVELEFFRCVQSDHALSDRIRIGMEQEPGASGKFSVRHFEKIAREAVPGSSVKEFPATQSKLLNAQPWLAAAEAGGVYLVDDGEDGLGWNKDFNEEAETFPEGAHDDIVDSIAGAYKLATGKKGIRASIGRSDAALAAISQQKLQAEAKNGQNRRSSVTFGRNLRLDSADQRGYVGLPR
jgi:predicted phage terminase large subunit-like protein